MRKANKYKKIRTILRNEFGNTLLTCDRYNLSEQVMYLMIDKNIPIAGEEKELKNIITGRYER